MHLLTEPTPPLPHLKKIMLYRCLGKYVNCLHIIQHHHHRFLTEKFISLRKVCWSLERQIGKQFRCYVFCSSCQCFLIMLLFKLVLSPASELFLLKLNNLVPYNKIEIRWKIGIDSLIWWVSIKYSWNTVCYSFPVNALFFSNKVRWP